MSASREKRQRKLQSAAAEELDAKKNKKDGKDNGLRYKVATVIVVVALVLSAVFFVYQGFVKPNAAAVTIAGEKVYDHELSYYYINSYSNFVSQVGDYASTLFGLDTSKSLASQPYYADSSMTWHDYFLGSAKSSVQQVHMLVAAAEADGVTLSAENEQNVQNDIQSLQDYVDSNGYDISAYLKNMYGKRMDLTEYERLLRNGYLATQYSDTKYDSFADAITDSDIETYYEDNRNDFDLVTYRRYLVTADTDTDMTDDERTAALDTARSTAERIAAASTNEAEFIAQVVTRQNEVAQKTAAESEPDEDGNLPEPVEYTSADAETDTLMSNTTYSQATSTEQADWLFSADRVTGETTTFDTTNGTYVMFFLDRTRNNYNTIDVRHILVSFDDFDADGNPVSDDAETAEDTDDSTEDTGTTDAQKEAATAEAERILEEWKNGAATEDSFAELAKQYSDDGNAADGGIYEQVYKGQMVTEFENWCFDASRKTGDTDVVETSYGEHVMYFVGEDTPYWQVQVKTVKANEDYSNWQTAELEKFPVVEKTGIGNVGLN